MHAHDIDFISQRNHPCALYGCGVASTMMLLKGSHILPLPSYRRLIKELRLKSPGPLGEPGPAVFSTDLARYFRHRRLRTRSIRRKNAQTFQRLRNWLEDGPIMVLVYGAEWGNEEHWFVLIGEEGKGLVYLDPWYKPSARHRRHVDRERFRAMWRGAAFQLLSRQRRQFTTENGLK